MESNNKNRGAGAFIVLTVAIVLLISCTLGIGTYYFIKHPTDFLANIPGGEATAMPGNPNTLSPSIQNSEYIDPSVTVLPQITPPTIDTNEPIADLYDKMVDTVVMVCSYNTNGALQGTGTGVVFTENGYAITNHHVIEEAQKITVVMNDERELDAVVVGSDQRTDIAVLKITEGSDFHAAPLGNSDSLRIGQTVVAIGSPLGNNGTLTRGIVSYLNRAIDEDGIRRRMIQTDCAINPGNSGGPLFNLSGEVIGITSMKEVYTTAENGEVPVEGIGYAIPINIAKNIALELINTGYVQRGAIGIMAQSNIINNSFNGVRVVEVTSGGPADNAGIKVNDVITEIDSVTVKKMEDLSEQLSYKRVGDMVTLKILRNNKEMNFTVKLTELVE